MIFLKIYLVFKYRHKGASEKSFMYIEYKRLFYNYVQAFPKRTNS